MCGIAGIAGKDSRRIPEQQFRNALSCLKHRGPEGEGFWTDAKGSVQLGHRRLRIIDLSAAAAQPMSYGDRYHILHNGELYNYVELREELLQKGCTFSTQSDTEVILAAYATYGSDCLQHFEGMF